VQLAAHSVTQHGRRVATPQEARHIFGLSLIDAKPTN
jgi:hypothetical protein